ncbi:MAG: FAD-dependent oxidoreductase [Prevotella sp.]|jgi:hypothetical protein|nr:FAD-dependent oxidoreductase [Prevotella sp.]
MKKIILIILSIYSFSLFIGAQDIFIETESFQYKGGWVLDQQFMDLMGSSYLMAHGLGNPVEDAYTTVNFSEKGRYNIYVRTFNWTSPWYSGEGAGRFTLKVNGKKLSIVLGDKGDKWEWQYAGSFSFKEGENIIALHDLSGFNGRCDAIFFTKEEGKIPPSDIKDLTDFRKQMLNIPSVPTTIKEYDFVVVGAGIAGMCAAVSAARKGCKVALINDRPIIGGNNSSEIRVHLGGRIGLPPYENLGNLLKEFGHSRGGNAQPVDYYEDEKKMDFILQEKNIDLFVNCRAIAINMSGNKIESIITKHIETGEEYCFKAPVFSDCTGDGTIGYLARADYLMGREGKDDFGEDIAPEKADKMTMGTSVQWYSADKSKKTDFPQFNYGVSFSDESCEKVMMGEWTWETGMNKDQVFQAETIRDYGLMVVLSNWSFLKNNYKEKEKYNNRELDWVAYIAGKRESRRLLGDYILKEDDIVKNVFHEDATATASWSIDLHFPDPDNTRYFPGEEFKAKTNHIKIYPYPIPYRCLYSRNIDNLFMAGRNISVTHVALGTTRVMRTTGMLGEVVGLAASLCKEHNATPREIYFYHLPDLKELMKAGAGKQGLPNNQQFNMGDMLDKSQK